LPDLKFASPAKSRFAALCEKAFSSARTTVVAPPASTSRGSISGAAGGALEPPSPQASAAGREKGEGETSPPSRLHASPLFCGERQSKRAGVLPEVAGRDPERLDRVLDHVGLGFERLDRGHDVRLRGALLDLVVERHAVLRALVDDAELRDRVGERGSEPIGDVGVVLSDQEVVDAGTR
jgi:hypothetical protein